MGGGGRLSRSFLSKNRRKQIGTGSRGPAQSGSPAEDVRLKQQCLRPGSSWPWLGPRGLRQDLGTKASDGDLAPHPLSSPLQGSICPSTHHPEAFLGYHSVSLSPKAQPTGSPPSVDPESSTRHSLLRAPDPAGTPCIFQGGITIFLLFCREKLKEHILSIPPSALPSGWGQFSVLQQHPLLSIQPASRTHSAGQVKNPVTSRLSELGG